MQDDYVSPKGKVVTPSRINHLLEHYDISPEVIAEKRRLADHLWYALQTRRTPDSFQTQEEILQGAIEQAQSGKIAEWPRWVFKSPSIRISEEDLDKLQSAKNIMLHPMHQKYIDIPYVAQMLIELWIWHDKTHYVMKPSVPFPGYFESAGWVMLKRKKDIDKERRTWKVDNRDRLMNTRELPPFFQHFMTEENERNMVIYPQWERQKEIDDAFVFGNKNIIRMQENMDATQHCEHVVVAIDYRWSQVEMTLKVLTEDEMRDGQLGITVNWFLDEVKDNN